MKGIMIVEELIERLKEHNPKSEVGVDIDYECDQSITIAGEYDTCYIVVDMLGEEK